MKRKRLVESVASKRFFLKKEAKTFISLVRAVDAHGLAFVVVVNCGVADSLAVGGVMDVVLAGSLGAVACS